MDELDDMSFIKKVFLFFFDILIGVIYVLFKKIILCKCCYLFFFKFVFNLYCFLCFIMYFLF